MTGFCPEVMQEHLQMIKSLYSLKAMESERMDQKLGWRRFSTHTHTQECIWAQGSGRLILLGDYWTA